MKRVSLNNIREEILEQDFFVESTVITTVVHKVRANSFEQAKSLIERGLVSSENVVDTTAHKVMDDVTEKYRGIISIVDESLKGRGLK